MADSLSFGIQTSSMSTQSLTVQGGTLEHAVPIHS